MIEPRGFGFDIRAEVDAYNASDTVTRRPRTGLLVYLNWALVQWFYNKKNRIEISTFVSEFFAMEVCCKYIYNLRYKLRMMGILVNGADYIEVDNQSVLSNTTIPNSTIKKKSQSILYHFVHEGVAREKWRTWYISTDDNKADLLTNQLL